MKQTEYKFNPEGESERRIKSFLTGQGFGHSLINAIIKLIGMHFSSELLRYERTFPNEVKFAKIYTKQDDKSREYYRQFIGAMQMDETTVLVEHKVFLKII